MRKVCGLVAGLVTMQGAWAQPYLGFVAGCLRR